MHTGREEGLTRRLYLIDSQMPTVAILGSGGGFRAMVSLSGVYCALKDVGVLDCAMYTTGLSGSAW